MKYNYKYYFLQIIERNGCPFSKMPFPNLIKLSKIMASITFGIKQEKCYCPMDYNNIFLRSIINLITCHILHGTLNVFH